MGMGMLNLLITKHNSSKLKGKERVCGTYNSPKFIDERVFKGTQA
jgi:hypothetical protein